MKKVGSRGSRTSHFPALQSADTGFKPWVECLLTLLPALTLLLCRLVRGLESNRKQVLCAAGHSPVGLSLSSRLTFATASWNRDRGHRLRFTGRETEGRAVSVQSHRCQGLTLGRVAPERTSLRAPAAPWRKGARSAGCVRPETVPCRGPLVTLYGACPDQACLLGQDSKACKYPLFRDKAVSISAASPALGTQALEGPSLPRAAGSAP